MKPCLNEDTLLRIAAALEWQVDEPLRHVHDCAECALKLSDLRGIGQTLARSETPDPELLAQIIAALNSELSAEDLDSRPSTRAVVDRGMRFLAVVTIAVVVLGTAAAMRTGDVSFAPTLLLSVLSGAIASVISGRGSMWAGRT